MNNDKRQLNEDKDASSGHMQQLVRPEYKFLYGLIMLMGRANGMTPKQFSQWPLDRDINYAELDKQASLLSETEAEIMVDGEIEEMWSLTLKYRILALHNFLNFAFDGSFNCLFYEA